MQHTTVNPDKELNIFQKFATKELLCNTAATVKWYYD